MRSLILASASPRRRELLTRAGVEIQCQVPDCDESGLEGESAVEYVARVALLKAQAIVSKGPHAQDWILAADTTVWIPDGGAPLGKPATREAAREGLNALFEAGMHHVSTAFCILNAKGGTKVHSQVVSTRVWMRRPGDAELEHYLDTKEWADKAGGYGIQGAAAGFVTRLEGSYTNVVGLPLAEVLAVLKPE